VTIQLDLLNSLDLIVKSAFDEHFQSLNICIQQKRVHLLNNDVKRFNDRMISKQWENEDDFDNMTSTCITVLDDIVIIDDNIQCHQVSRSFVFNW